MKSVDRRILILRMLPIIMLLIMAWVADVFSETESHLKPARIVDLYSQAKDLFRQANEVAAADPDSARDLYEKSAMRYERIIRQGGVQNGKLYYNLGNTYFRMKDLGMAILNYRRAEQFIPNDPNLRQNLDYARKRRLDEIEEKQETRVMKTLFFWHYDLSTRARVMAFTVSFGSLWVFAGIRLFMKRPFTSGCITAALLLSFFLGGSLAAEQYSLHHQRPGVIISQATVARKGNSETYEPSFKDPLHSGTEFTLIEDRDPWVHVELADARTCWLPSKDVALVR